MQIRKMKPDDLSEIARVNVDTFTQTQGGFVPDSFIDALTYDATAQRFERILNKPEGRSTIFVAEDNGNIIGYAMCGLATTLRVGGFMKH